MIDVLDLLTLRGTLKKSGMHQWKKPLNLEGTEEKNRKMVNALILLAPRSTLKISSLNSYMRSSFQCRKVC